MKVKELSDEWTEKTQKSGDYIHRKDEKWGEDTSFKKSALTLDSPVEKYLQQYGDDQDWATACIQDFPSAVQKP